MENNNPYLIRKLEDSNQSYIRSFSNRYMNWKRCYSIIKSLDQEIKKINLKGKTIKILDIGCGDGWVIYELKSEFDKKYQLEFTGIDISSLDIDFANQRKQYFHQQNCDFQIMDAQALRFNDESFNIIISSEVIEHILEPVKVIRQVRRVLKKRGLFIITTPQKEGGLFARAARLIKRRSNAPSQEMTCRATEVDNGTVRIFSNQSTTRAGPGHIFVKAQKEWIEIFKKAGFQLISVKGTGGLFFGGPYLDAHRLSFALNIILDVFLEKLPSSNLWSEMLLFELRK